MSAANHLRTETYRGRRRGDGACEVVAEPGGRPLDPRHDLWNHSPDGFEWGYHGSGPAQLALALLADALGDDERAVRLHQKFKRVFVARLRRDREWDVAAGAVREIADEVDAESALADRGREAARAESLAEEPDADAAWLREMAGRVMSGHRWSVEDVARLRAIAARLEAE